MHVLLLIVNREFTARQANGLNPGLLTSNLVTSDFWISDLRPPFLPTPFAGT